MSAHRARRCFLSIGASILIVIASGCSSDDTADGPQSSAAGSEPSSTSPDETYVVESGDAVSAIADRHCVSAAALAEANEWSDGVNHVIQPGDAIALPAGACEPATEGDDDGADTPATTRQPTGATITRPGAAGPTTTVNEYIESYRFDGGVPVIPMLGDPELYVGGDPRCFDAFDGLMQFNQGLADVDDLLADLDTIGVTPTAAQLRNLEDWQAWKDRYLNVYLPVRADLLLIDMSDEVAVEALLAEPAYVEASDAAGAIVGPAESTFMSMVDSVRVARQRVISDGALTLG